MWGGHVTESNAAIVSLWATLRFLTWPSVSINWFLHGNLDGREGRVFTSSQGSSVQLPDSAGHLWSSRVRVQTSRSDCSEVLPVILEKAWRIALLVSSVQRPFLWANTCWTHGTKKLCKQLSGKQLELDLDRSSRLFALYTWVWHLWLFGLKSVTIITFEPKVLYLVCFVHFPN